MLTDHIPIAHQSFCTEKFGWTHAVFGFKLVLAYIETEYYLVVVGRSNTQYSVIL